MAKAYSDDLRKRVMMAYDSGEEQRAIAKRFSITEKTIYLWRRQRESRGHNRAITKYQRGHSHKITDIARFKDFVAKNHGMTTVEMAKAWGGLSRKTISRKLKALGFTRKKKFWLQKSQ